MTATVVRCPYCEGWSECIYRCDLCGADLAEHELQVLEERPDQSLEDLVDVEFRYECLGCGRRRELALDYQDVGTIVRLGCPSEECEEPTRHRPLGKDQYRPYWDLVDDVDERDASPTDHPAAPIQT